MTDVFVFWKFRGGLVYRFVFVRFVKKEDVTRVIRGENGRLLGEFRIKV